MLRVKFCTEKLFQNSILKVLYISVLVLPLVAILALSACLSKSSARTVPTTPTTGEFTLQTINATSNDPFSTTSPDSLTTTQVSLSTTSAETFSVATSELDDLKVSLRNVVIRARLAFRNAVRESFLYHIFPSAIFWYKLFCWKAVNHYKQNIFHLFTFVYIILFK